MDLPPIGLVLQSFHRASSVSQRIFAGGFDNILHIFQRFSPDFGALKPVTVDIEDFMRIHKQVYISITSLSRTSMAAHMVLTYDGIHI